MFWRLFSEALWLLNTVLSVCFPGAGTVCVGTPPHGANARSERRDAFRVTALVSVKTSGGSGGVEKGSYCSRGSGGREGGSDVRM